MAQKQPFIEQLDIDGFALISDVLSSAECESLIGSLPVVEHGRRLRGGVRHLLSHPSVRASCSARLRALVEPVLGTGARAVRALLFDKTPEANWKVIWHQDLTLALRERRDGTDGFGPWTVKDGVPHVIAPAIVLERMLSVRLHLDDSDADNGPLRVLPGTHRYGRIDADHVATSRGELAEVTCVAPRGSALLFRPLLLHASSAGARESSQMAGHGDRAFLRKLHRSGHRQQQTPDRR